MVMWLAVANATSPAKAETVVDTSLGFSLAIPAGFMENRDLEKARRIVYAFTYRTTSDGEPAIILFIQDMRGPIDRSPLRSEDLPPNAKFRHFHTKWQGFEVDTFKVPERLNDVETLTYNVQIPLKRKAIQVSLFGPASRRAELERLLPQVVAELHGESNWLPLQQGMPPRPKSTDRDPSAPLYRFPRMDATQQDDCRRTRRSPQYLPSGQVRASIYSIVVSERARTLLKRSQDAIASNAEWFQAYRREHDFPLPYHPNFGVTEAEYNELFQMLETVKFTKVGESDLFFKSDESGVTSLAATGPLDALNGIRINPLSKRASVPAGDFDEYVEIEASDAQRATGPWHGHQWQLTAREENCSRTTTLAIGQHNETGDGVLYYKVTAHRDGVEKDEQMLFLRYPIDRAGLGGATLMSGRWYWMLFAIASVWLLLGFGAASVAVQRKYPLVIGFLSAVLGPLGLLILLLGPRRIKGRQQPEHDGRIDVESNLQEGYACPKCGRQNAEGTRVCPRCEYHFC